MPRTLRAVGSSIHDDRHNSVFYEGDSKHVLLNPSRNKDPSATFSGLRSGKRDALRKRCREALLPRMSLLHTVLFCYRPVEIAERRISPTFFRLVEHLGPVAPATVGIFRREGDKRLTRELVAGILAFDRSGHSRSAEFDFAPYKALELASALKHYIRDVLNGLFDARLIERILASIIANDRSSTQRHCRCLVFSLTQEQRDFFIALKSLLKDVAANKHATKISWGSICNILSLTLAPAEAFRSLQQIPVIVDLFRNVMEVDTEDVRGLV